MNAQPKTIAPPQYDHLKRLIDSPCGPLLAIADCRGICQLAFASPAIEANHNPCRSLVGYPSWLRQACQHLDRLTCELHEYFQGHRQHFTVPLVITGSLFQRKVWSALLTIPYGEVRSYQQMAEEVGQPRAARAVGQANARNPICILIPCHRVIAAKGTPGGYQAGLELKRRLLTLEGFTLSSEQPGWKAYPCPHEITERRI